MRLIFRDLRTADQDAAPVDHPSIDPMTSTLARPVGDRRPAALNGSGPATERVKSRMQMAVTDKGGGKVALLQVRPVPASGR